MIKKVKELFALVAAHFAYKALFALCIGAVFCLNAYKGSSNIATAYLELNYPKALYGQYLNGTRLNIYDILSEEILQKAIEKTGLADELTVYGLSDMLTVLPRHSSNPINKYIATEFEVGIETDGSLGNVDAQGILQMVCMAFVETFYDAHAYSQTEFSFGAEDVPGMNYDEIGVMLQTKIDLIADYVDYRRSGAPDFSSVDTGESFTSLRQKILDFSNIIMENYNAYVLNNGVTRDIDELRSTIEYEQLLLTNSYDKNIAAYDVRIEAIDDYDPDQSAIVMIPTVDELGEFYMSKTKIGVDYLAEAANSSMSLAVATKKTIDRNATRLSIANSVTQAQRARAALKLDAMIDNILDSLGEIEQLVIKTDDEYIRKQTAESLTYRIRYVTMMERYEVKISLVVMAGAFVALSVVLQLFDNRRKRPAAKVGDVNA